MQAQRDMTSRIFTESSRFAHIFYGEFPARYETHGLLLVDNMLASIIEGTVGTLK
jgi:hypothetical protein